MTHRRSRPLAPALAWLLACLGTATAVPAQLIPPGIQRKSPEAAAPALSGRWRGEARETVPGVGDTRYPIELTFSGSPEALTLDVRGTARIESEGQRLTVEIRATYRGALGGDRLRMRSERIETRVVEYDQVLPSTPQSLEAQLTDGVLRGRVGNEGEGWTTFEARAADGAGVEPDARPAPTLAGTWRGTGREPGPQGGELRYPVRLTLRADGDRLIAEMHADVDYPDGQGGTVAVEVSATLRGTRDGDGFTLASDSSRVHVPSRNLTQDGPPQRGRGRLDGDVLRIEIGDDPASVSRLELRRDGAAADGTERGDPAASEGEDGSSDVDVDVGEAPEARPAPTLAGAWRGTGREPGPQGGELRYPVRLTLRADGDRLTAEMRADVEYPDGQGGTVAVEVSATLRGTRDGDGFTLASDSSRIHVPSRNLTQDGPPQRGRGRLDGDVLRIEMGDDPASISRLELRRDGAAADGVERPRESGDGDRRHREAGDAARPASGGGAARDSTPGAATLVLEPRELRDPGMGNVISHRLLVPAGWTFEGGPRWGSTQADLVQFVGELRGTADQRLTFAPSLQFNWSAVSGQPAEGAEGPGVPKFDGTLQRRPPSQYGEVATQILLPRLRPGATDVQLVHVERLDQVEQRFREVYAEPLRLIEQIQADIRAGSSNGVQGDGHTFVVAERAVLRYREGGAEWEEEFRSTQFGSVYTVRADFMATENASWSISEARSCRAPAGRLDAELPTLLSLAGAVREEPSWSLAVAKLRAELQAAAARGRQIAMEDARRRAAATAGESVSDIQMRGWRERQASVDRMHKATIDSITESHDFRTTDGGTFAVSNHFDRAFHDGQGRLILTNAVDFQPNVDPLFRDRNWQELQRVDPSGGR